jgi:hypothetical protein
MIIIIIIIINNNIIIIIYGNCLSQVVFLPSGAAYNVMLGSTMYLLQQNLDVRSLQCASNTPFIAPLQPGCPTACAANVSECRFVQSLIPLYRYRFKQ